MKGPESVQFMCTRARKKEPETIFPLLYTLGFFFSECHCEDVLLLCSPVYSRESGSPPDCFLLNPRFLAAWSMSFSLLYSEQLSLLWQEFFP